MGCFPRLRLKAEVDAGEARCRKVVLERHKRMIKESRAKICQATARIPARTGTGLEAERSRTLFIWC